MVNDEALPERSDRERDEPACQGAGAQSPRIAPRQGFGGEDPRRSPFPLLKCGDFLINYGHDSL